ncbi:MFS general substrate transporter [Hesseltinella vesiculosa]|uniref:MFS general substrate transporter n=1 Tax=Hesseltinella vesiculosa TaxID=101127 RepID=A0A1X2G2Q8_9FUNG|nr:MFS general substrate transporter [Hesseltinella vesiculosa]
MSTDEKTLKAQDISVQESVVQEDISDHREPPDGGISWVVLIGCFCGLFATQGYGYAYGVFMDYYNTNVYPNELTNLTWIGSLWYALTNITGPIYVYMCGKVGYKWMIGVGCILSCLAMELASITNAVWQLYITQGIMSGIASSLVWFPCISAPQQWFDKKRGLAVGLAFAGSGIGGLVLSYITRAAMDNLGWQWALRILGFIQLVMIGIAYFTVRPLNPLPREVPLMDFKPFKNKKFLVLFAIHFVFNFALYIPSAYMSSYATSIGISPLVSTSLTGVLSALMFVGKVSNGFVSDFVGRSNQMVICLLLTGVFMVSIWYTASSAGSLWAFTVLYGIFGGGCVTTITSVIAECVGMDQVESATGWLFFAWFFGGLLGQPIAAQIIEKQNGAYGGAILFGGCLYLFNAILAIVLRYMRSGNQHFIRI